MARHFLQRILILRRWLWHFWALMVFAAVAILPGCSQPRRVCYQNDCSAECQDGQDSVA
jgi:hypothetical protein